MSRKAFSLIEAVVGITIISITSMACWISLETLNRMDETLRKNNKANYLIQKSQEELRKVAQAMYDTLEDCDYSEDNLCGFESDISKYFEGFSREIRIKRYPDTTELKLAHMTIRWKNMGEETERHSVMILSRPPNPMPGNITGEIKDSATGELVGDVKIILSRIDGGKELTAVSSSGPLREAGINYDFIDDEFDRYVLMTGIWKMKAMHPAFKDYIHPVPIIVRPDQETRVNFEILLARRIQK